MASFVFGFGVLSLAQAEEAPPSVQTEFGKGVTFRSKEGDFELNLRARAQFRFDAVFPAEGSSALRSNDFMVRRARISLKSVYKKHLRFDVQLAVARQDMEADAPNILRDAYLTYTRFRDLNLRVGQMKVPFGRQRVVSSSALQMVDRAAVVGELNLDRDVGAQLRSDDLLGWNGRLSYQMGVFGGDGRNRVGPSNGLLYVARLQFSPLGGIENELQEADLSFTATPKFALGFAAARNVDTRRVRSTLGDTVTEGIDYNHFNIDFLLRYQGLSLTSEFLLRRATADRNATAKNRSGMGYFVQGGWLLTRQVEATARYGDFLPDAQSVAGLKRQKEIGTGLSWYLNDHNLKIQADYIALSNDDFAHVDSTGRIQTQFFF